MSNFPARTRRTRADAGTVSTRRGTGPQNIFPTPLPDFTYAPSIRCLTFGPLRRENWGSEYLFCSKCDEAEQRMRTHKKLKWPNLESRAYKCECKHTSSAEPQKKTEKSWCPSKSPAYSSSKKSKSLSSVTPKRKKNKISQELFASDDEDEVHEESLCLEEVPQDTSSPVPHQETPAIHVNPQDDPQLLKNTISDLKMQIHQLEEELVRSQRTIDGMKNDYNGV